MERVVRSCPPTTRKSLGKSPREKWLCQDLFQNHNSATLSTHSPHTQHCQTGSIFCNSSISFLSPNLPPLSLRSPPACLTFFHCHYLHSAVSLSLSASLLIRLFYSASLTTLQCWSRGAGQVTVILCSEWALQYAILQPKVFYTVKKYIQLQNNYYSMICRRTLNSCKVYYSAWVGVPNKMFFTNCSEIRAERTFCIINSLNNCLLSYRVIIIILANSCYFPAWAPNSRSSFHPPTAGAKVSAGASSHSDGEGEYIVCAFDVEKYQEAPVVESNTWHPHLLSKLFWFVDV